MGTYRPRNGSFSRNLYRNLSEINRPAPVVDLDRIETDDLYAKLWIITARAELAELVNTQQLADFLTEIQTLSPARQYHKIAAQVLLERAARLEPVNPYYQTEDGVMGGDYEAEIIF